MIEILAILAILGGIFFFLTGSIGLIRLPDLFSRLHALSKADNIGLALVALGVAILEPEKILILKIIMIWLLVLAASAISSHMIAKHASQGGKQND